MRRMRPDGVSLSLSLAAVAKSLQSCPNLCDPIDGSPPGSPVPGILQARILEWVAISFSNACMHAKLLQSCPTLCDSMDSSPPGSSPHGILQARILEWVSISFSSLSLTWWNIEETSRNFKTLYTVHLSFSQKWQTLRLTCYLTGMWSQKRLPWQIFKHS